jgi:hypothetical protein
MMGMKSLMNTVGGVVVPGQSVTTIGGLRGRWLKNAILEKHIDNSANP